jgi:hypothetical protein
MLWLRENDERAFNKNKKVETMSNQRQRNKYVLFISIEFEIQYLISDIILINFRCTTMIGENPDPLNTSIETGNIDPLSAVTNLLENPSASKVRLRQLLRQVEKEFEAVLIENVALRKELERYGGSNTNAHGTTTSKLRASNIFPMIRNRVVLRTGNQSDDLIFSSTNQHRDVIWDVQV